MGGLLSRLGLWWEDPAANYACSRILDGDMCINENCVWYVHDYVPRCPDVQVRNLTRYDDCVCGKGDGSVSL